MKITIPLSYTTYLEKIRASKKLQIVLVCIMLVAVSITVYAVKQIQELRSQAQVETGSKTENGLSVTDDADIPLPYEGNNTYKTNSLEIKLKIKDLEKLVE